MRWRKAARASVAAKSAWETVKTDVRVSSAIAGEAKYAAVKEAARMLTERGMSDLPLGSR